MNWLGNSKDTKQYLPFTLAGIGYNTIFISLFQLRMGPCPVEIWFVNTPPPIIIQRSVKVFHNHCAPYHGKQNETP